MLQRIFLTAIAVIYGLNLFDIIQVSPVALTAQVEPSAGEKPSAGEEPSALSISTPATAASRPLLQEQFVNIADAMPRVHAPTAIINAEGELHSYWYGGTREGARDVAIYGARFDSLTNTWTDHRKVIDRISSGKRTRRGVSKIGNPVAYTHPDGRVWLFYVNVSIGGWAWSTINLATSTDGGMTFTDDKRLVTSPFFNRSTLVKSPPINLSDGSVGLPAYHELASKHGELIKIDVNGDVIDKRRIPSTLPALQPALVSTTDGRLLAFLRNAADENRMLLRSESVDQGITWSQATNVNVPNPNSAIAVETTPSGLLLAFNDHPENRDILSLAHSEDNGHSWQVFHVLEYKPNINKQDHTNEFSYPWFVKDQAGVYNLFYTWQRTHIKHVRFNEAWLAEKLQGVI